jgi:DNA transformation protein
VLDPKKAADRRQAMGTKGARYSEDVGEFAEELAGALGSLGEVSWKKMFGGAGVFVDGSLFALIGSDARLHLKVEDTNRDRYEAAGCEKHGRMPYYVVPKDVVGDDDALIEWAGLSAEIATG